jgi:uroporphyrinogen-III synthase
MTPVVVTRPEAAGRELAAQLSQAGLEALWLPAFELGAAPEPSRVVRVLGGLATYDLVVFVSPAAVHAVASLLPQAWPRQTRLAVVGAASAAALRDLPALAGLPIIEPQPEGDGAPGEMESGSEALWSTLRSTPGRPGPAAKRVLILRAQHGREWLAQRLRESGAEVEALAVYTRGPHAISAAEADWLQRRQGAPIDSVFSSSEAVAALKAALSGRMVVWRALQQGRALASHPRIAERLNACGFADVRLCRLDPGAIAAALRRG